jgi:hypothetical protein
MFKISLFTLALLFFSACSLETGENAADSANNPPGSNRFIQPLQPERFLTETEVARLARICRATNEARMRTDSFFDGELQYVFSLQRRDCGQGSLVNRGTGIALFRRPVSGSAYLETVTSVSMVTDLLFDTHPYLNSLCSNIDTNTTIINRRADGSDILLYELLSNESMDVLQVTRYRTQANGSTTPAVVDIYKVYTEAITRNADILGDVYERTQVLPCSSSNQTQTRFQRLNQVQRL